MRQNNSLTKVKKLITNMMSWKHMREVASLLLTYVPKLIQLKEGKIKAVIPKKKKIKERGKGLFEVKYVSCGSNVLLCKTRIWMLTVSKTLISDWKLTKAINIRLGNNLYGSNDCTEVMYSSDKYDNTIRRDSWLSQIPVWLIFLSQHCKRFIYYEF